jgi:iron complex outermembrane receptor protein
MWQNARRNSESTVEVAGLDADPQTWRVQPYLVVLMLGAFPAYAQEQQTSTLEEIIVTAERQAENLQDVPLAVTALSAEGLDDRGVLNLYGLRSLAPNFDVSHNNGLVKVFIRGIGKTLDNSGAEGSVALHQDGVVISYPSVQSTAFYDMERIEVLRGPQGTLYGRNATGGAVNIVTRGPSEELQVDTRLRLGNYDARELEAAVGGPIVNDRLLGRLAAYVVERDGFGENAFNGKDVDDRSEWAARGKLKLLFTEKLTAELAADYWQADDAASVVHTFGSASGELLGVLEGGNAAPNFRDIASDAVESRDVDTYGYALTVDYAISDRWSFKSLTGYRDVNGVKRSQYDGTDAPGWPSTNEETGDHFSQEFQLNLDGDSLDAVFGVYYYDGDVFVTNTVPFEFANNSPGDIFDERGTASTEAYAAFGSMTWAATEKLNLTAGVRYSDEEKHTVSSFQIRVTPFVDAFIPMDATKSWDAWTPRFSVDYKFTDDVMGYVSASEGFKSGQILPGNTGPPIDPEFVWSYEAGLKSNLFDDRLRANLTAFYYDYTDLQVSQLSGLSFTITNAAAAEVLGFEAELAYLLGENTRLDLVYGYLDSEFTEFLTEDPIHPELGTLNLAGNPLPSAPENMFTLGLSHTMPTAVGNFDLRVDWRWRDEAFFDPYKRESASQDAYSDVSVRGSYTPRNYPNWEVSLWANNLFDEDAILVNYVSLAAGGFPRNGSVNDPLTYGLEVSFSL